MIQSEKKSHFKLSRIEERSRKASSIYNIANGAVLTDLKPMQVKY